MGRTIASLNRKLQGRRLITGLVAATLFAVACELTSPTESVIVIEMTTDSTLVVGTPVVPRFTVTVDGLPITDPRILLQSSNAAVIRVVGDTIQPLSRGTADLTIVLLSSTIGDQLPTVTQALRAVAATVDIAEPNVLFESLGDSVHLTPVALSSTGDTLSVGGATWITEDAAVATVNGQGRVQAVKNGAIDVRLVIDDDTASVPVTVSQKLTHYGISPNPLNIPSLGATGALTAVPLDAGGSPIPAGAAPTPTWATRDATIGTVTNTGTVTAVENGETYVVATAPNVADSVRLVVRQVATKVEILPSRTVLGAIQDTVRLSAVASDALGQDILNRLASWVSRDIRVAQVEPATGVVRALAQGTVVIVAKLDAAADSITLTIADSAAVVALPADTFRFRSLHDTTAVSVTVRNKFDAPVANQTVAWSTADPSVASVTSSGQLVANSIGTTVLVVRASDPAKPEAVDTATVVVNNLPETVNVVPVDTVLTSTGDQYSPAVDIRNSRGDPLDRTSASWSTKDSTVATVNSSGVVTAKGRGTTFILAVNPLNAARRDSVEITVSNAPAAVDLSPDNVVLTAPGRTKQYQVIVRNLRGDVIAGEPVQYISRNVGVATIDGVGLATGAAEGSTYLVAEAGGGGVLFPIVRDSVLITVQNNVVQVAVNPTSAIIPSVGDSLLLEARALNDFGNTVENVPFAWSSDDSNIADVNNLGLVVAKNVGRAIITVEFSGLKATSEIEVRNSPASIVIAESTLEFASVLDLQVPNVDYTVTLENSLGVPLATTSARWSSDNPLVAEVDDFGNITARARGVTTIRASNPLNAGISDGVLVRVLNTPVDIVIDPRAGQTTATRTDTLASIGRTLDYGAKVYNLRGNVINDVPVIWTTEFNTVATVSSTSPTTARATAAGPGSTRIAAAVDQSVLLEPLASALADTAVLVVRNNAAVLSISPNTVNLTSVGFSTNLTLTVLNEAGNPIDSPNVVWSVANPTIASVVEDGTDARLATVTALAAGNTSVIADVLDENLNIVKSTSVPVTVTNYPTSIAIVAPAAATLASVGNTLQLLPYTDGSANQVEIRNGANALLGLSAAQWSTSDGNVAQVTQGGKITATGAGAATITAANPVNPSIAATFSVTVTNATASLTISRDGSDITNTSFTLSPIPATANVKATPKNAAGGETTTPITWSSSVSGVVTITPNPDTRFAVITASGTGTTVVTATATDNSTTAQVTVTVTNPASTMTLTPPTGQILQPSGTLQLTATATNTLGTVLPDSDVVFALINPNDTTIATVSNAPATFGLVTATSIRSRLLSPQTVLVRARDQGNNKADTSTITVVVAPDTVRFEDTSIDFTSINEQKTPGSGYAITIKDAQGNTLAPSTVAWATTPNDGTITIDNATGRITAAKEGSVTLKATSLYDVSVFDEVPVTVTNVPTSVVITPSTFTITAVGATKQFAAAVKNALGGAVAGGTLTWSVGPDATNNWPTQADSVLNVDANTGLVTARKVGTGVLRATVDKDGTIVTGTATVTVTNVPVSIGISPETVNITSVGDSVKLVATPRNSEDAEILDYPVEWSVVSGPVSIIGSPNDTVWVKATGTGSATVQATAGVSNQRTITITNVIASIAFNADTVFLDGIGVRALKEDVVDVFNAVGGSIPATAASWSSTPAGIVTVTSDSIVAQAVGTTKVTAESPTNSAIRDTVIVKVTNVATNIALNDTGDTFARYSQSLSYTATVTNSQATEIPGATVNWNVAACAAPPAGVAGNAGAVSVSPTTGKTVTITSIADGCATVTATSGALTDEADFVVRIAKRLYVKQTSVATAEHGTIKYPFKTLSAAVDFSTANAGDTVVVQRTAANYIQSVTVSVPNLTIRGDTAGCGVSCTASQLPILRPGAAAPIVDASNVGITFEDLIAQANADTAVLQIRNPGAAAVRVNRVVISDPNGASTNGSGLRITGLSGANVVIDSLVVRDVGTGLYLDGTANNITITDSRLYRNAIGLRLPSTINGTLNASNNDVFDNSGAAMANAPTSGVPFANWWGDNRGPRAQNATDTTTVGDSLKFNGSFGGAVTGYDIAPNTSAGGTAAALVAKLNANRVVSGRVLVFKNQSNKWVTTLAVRAVDANGLPASGVTVSPSFSSSQAGDAVTCASCTTGSDGIARINVELNDKGQANTDLTGFLRTVAISVTGGGSGSVSIDVVFPAAGVPAQYVITVPDTTPTVGAVFTVTARVADAAGTLVDTVAARDVTWGTTNGGSFGSPTSQTSGGIATVQFTPSTSAGVTHTLSASDVFGLTGELAVTTEAGAATQFVILDPTDGTVDAPIAVTVQAWDQYGNVATGENRDVTLNADGSATGDGLVDIVNGVGTRNISNTVPETVNLSLTDSETTTLDVTSTQDVFFGPGAATQFVILDPTDGTVDNPITVTVQAHDQYGNVATGENRDVTLNADGSATGDGLVDIVNGVGTRNISNTTPETVNLSLTDSENTTLDVTSTQDLAFGVGAAAKFVILDPTDGTVDNPITVTVQAQDQHGNLVTTYGDDVTLTTSGATATGGGLVDIVNGVGSRAISNTKAETVTLGLQDSETTNLIVSSTQDVVFDNGVADRFILFDPTDGTVDAPITVTVVVTDQYLNLVEDYNDVGGVTVNTTGEATGGGLVDLVNGVGTIAISDTLAETVDLTLTDNKVTGFLLAPLGGVDVVFGHGAATTLAFTAQPLDANLGATLSTVEVTVRDQYNNTVANWGTNVTVAIGSGQSATNLTGTLTQGVTNGVASFNDLSIVNETGIYTLAVASDTLSGTSDTFTISP